MDKILICLLILNAIGAVLVFWDKRQAILGRYRIPERWFFLLALLGACPGIYVAMKLRRHKTKKKRFMIGLIAIFYAQAVAIALFYYVTNF